MDAQADLRLCCSLTPKDWVSRVEANWYMYIEVDVCVQQKGGESFGKVRHNLRIESWLGACKEP